MLITVQTGSDLPLYRQLAEQIRVAIEQGRLRPGDRLPSHRQLAAELVVNHLTVKRAFDGLEAAGLISRQRGQGSFVAADAAVVLRARQLSDLQTAFAQAATALLAVGVPRADLHSLIDESTA